MRVDKAVIKRSAVTVHHDISNECGALCLSVLYNLSKGEDFPHILRELQKRFAKNKTTLLILNTL